MKNLTVKPFKTVSEAVQYFLSDGASAGVIECLKCELNVNTYCRYKSLHVVIDTRGELEKPKKHKHLLPTLWDWFKNWRNKR